MDCLTAAALRHVGYDANATAERSDAADVSADREGYGVVLDAKAFRLSRTALNPKDYKVEALSAWRGERRFAGLVAPLAGYPDRRSRLFVEAARFNVTLLTFSHLQFMLAETDLTNVDLAPVWRLGDQLVASADVRDVAAEYWAQLDRRLCDALGLDITEWVAARRRYFGDMMLVADRETERLLKEIDRIRETDRDQLVELAIDALGLEGKLRVISAKKERTRRLLETLTEREAE